MRMGSERHCGVCMFLGRESTTFYIPKAACDREEMKATLCRPSDGGELSQLCWCLCKPLPRTAARHAGLRPSTSADSVADLGLRRRSGSQCQGPSLWQRRRHQLTKSTFLAWDRGSQFYICNLEQSRATVWIFLRFSFAASVKMSPVSMVLWV